MTKRLPDGIYELLEKRIDSFEKLDLVLALHRSPRKTMSVAELAQALKLSKETIRQAAMELRGVALVELTTRGEVQLLPPTSRDLEALTELARLYDEDKMAVVTTIGEIAVERIRNLASRAFADAFILRKKKPENDDDS